MDDRQFAGHKVERLDPEALLELARSKDLHPSRLRRIEVDFGELVEVFGWPSKGVGDEKTQAEWAMLIEGLGMLWIWDYKESVPPEQVKEWSVWSDSTDLLKMVDDELVAID